MLMIIIMAAAILKDAKRMVAIRPWTEFSKIKLLIKSLVGSSVLLNPLNLCPLSSKRMYGSAILTVVNFEENE
jgi:hypothetical protein